MSELQVHAFAPGVDPDDAALEPGSDLPRGFCFAFVGADLLLRQDAEERPTVPTWQELREWDVRAVRRQYLGRLGNEPVWAAELHAESSPPPRTSINGLRTLFDQLPEVLYALAGRAVQIMAWQRDHQFCGRCGQDMTPLPGERALRCANCGLISYPRISPAVIVLIEREDRILLARGHQFGSGRFGIIAGFVEPGESLEDAVRREVREEVGIELANVSYFGSQPWPFPHGIMIGFRARYASGDISIDEGEIAEADWYDLDDLPHIPHKLSIARWLIDAWASERGAVIDQP